MSDWPTGSSNSAVVQTLQLPSPLWTGIFFWEPFFSNQVDVLFFRCDWLSLTSMVQNVLMMVMYIGILAPRLRSLDIKTLLHYILYYNSFIALNKTIPKTVAALLPYLKRKYFISASHLYSSITWKLTLCSKLLYYTLDDCCLFVIVTCFLSSKFSSSQCNTCMVILFFYRLQKRRLFSFGLYFLYRYDMRLFRHLWPNFDDSFFRKGISVVVTFKFEEHILPVC